MSFYGSIKFIFDFINPFRVNGFLPKMEVNDNIFFISRACISSFMALIQYSS